MYRFVLRKEDVIELLSVDGELEGIWTGKSLRLIYV